MGVRQVAETDLVSILGDSDYGFGYAITVIDPDGTSAALTGFSTDVAQLIDPDTGQAVSGRVASVSIAQRTLADVGFSSPLPVGIADASLKPWRVAFDDILSNAYSFKVVESNPDYALGIIVMIVEAYIAP